MKKKKVYIKSNKKKKSALLHLVYTMKFIKLVHGFSASYSNSRGKNTSSQSEMCLADL